MVGRPQGDDEPYPKRSWGERWQATKDGAWALAMPIFILGSIRFGFATPTEAAVVATVYALFVGMFHLQGAEAKPALWPLPCGCEDDQRHHVPRGRRADFSWLITAANIPGEIGKLLEAFTDNKMLLMFLLMVLVLVVGTALDFAPTVLILTPVLMPIVKQAGIDPVYFGVLFIMNNAIG